MDTSFSEHNEAGIRPDPEEIKNINIPIDQDHEENSRQFVIYKALEEHGQLSFNELAEKVADQMARNTLKKRLEDMKEDGIVNQTPTDAEWRQGQSKTYELSVETHSKLQDALNSIKVAKLDYLYGYKYDKENNEVNVRNAAPGVVWIEALETYHNNPNVDHVELCRQSAEKMLGETVADFDEDAEVPETFNKLLTQAVDIAAGRVFSEVFSATLELNNDMKKDLMMLAYGEVAEFGLFWDEVWEESWDVPYLDDT